MIATVSLLVTNINPTNFLGATNVNYALIYINKQKLTRFIFPPNEIKALKNGLGNYLNSIRIDSCGDEISILVFIFIVLVPDDNETIHRGR